MSMPSGLSSAWVSVLAPSAACAVALSVAVPSSWSAALPGCAVVWGVAEVVGLGRQALGSAVRSALPGVLAWVRCGGGLRWLGLGSRRGCVLRRGRGLALDG